jgi:hypothetical protein
VRSDERERAKVMVIYAPPYGEDPAKVKRV